MSASTSSPTEPGLPHARQLSGAAGLEVFEAFENRFARQARISILIAGLSGLYMLYALEAWDRFRDSAFWWLDLMIAVWLLFAVMIYLLEPLFLHERFRAFVRTQPERASRSLFGCTRSPWWSRPLQ